MCGDRRHRAIVMASVAVWLMFGTLSTADGRDVRYGDVTPASGKVNARKVDGDSWFPGAIFGIGAPGMLQSKQESRLRWRVLGFPGPRIIRIGNYVSWCPDGNTRTPRPKIRRIRRIERRRSVIVTAFLVNRAQEDCAGVEVLVEYLVKLRHKLGQRSLYDGSTSPPTRRWPTG